MLRLTKITSSVRTGGGVDGRGGSTSVTFEDLSAVGHGVLFGKKKGRDLLLLV